MTYILVSKGVWAVMKQSSPAQQQADILLAKQGDEAAFERLLTDYAPLITSAVKSTITEFSFSDSDYEDLYQEAVIFFFRALNRYDTQQDGVAFGLFAKICIQNGLRTQAKKLKKRDDLLACTDGADPLENASGEGAPSERLIEEERYVMLYQSVRATLSTYENRVWWLYLSGLTANNIAARLQKSERSIQNAIYRIRKKLRASLTAP